MEVENLTKILVYRHGNSSLNYKNPPSREKAGSGIIE